MIRKLSSGRSLLIIGLTSYLLFAVVTFPAKLAVAWFAPDDIVITNVSGTIWSGHSAAVVTPYITLLDTTWRARPLSLLTAKLGYRVTAAVAGGTIETIALITPGGTIHLKNLSGVLPLSVFPGIAPSVTIDGRMGLDVEHLLIKDQWLTDAHGTVDIVGLSLLTPVAETLGSYEIVFAGANETSLDGQIKEVDGPLVVAGTVSLDLDRNWRLAGTVKPTAAASSQLSQGLAFLGQPNPDGSYSLSYPTQ